MDKSRYTSNKHAATVVKAERKYVVFVSTKYLSSFKPYPYLNKTNCDSKWILDFFFAAQKIKGVRVLPSCTTRDMILFTVRVAFLG